MHILGHCSPKTDLVGQGKSPGSCSFNKFPIWFLLLVIRVLKLLTMTIFLGLYPFFALTMAVISIVSRFTEFNIWN